MNKSSNKIIKQKIYQDLLDKLSSESENYPWSPESTEDYYESLDPPSGVKDYLKSPKAIQKSSDFFNQIKELYPSNPKDKVKQTLLKQFGESVPSTWLEAIVEQIQANYQETSSLLNQLINCVQPLFSDWFSEDLQVFARPIAYPMRGSQEIPSKTWTELSQSEQIRLTFTITKVALETYQQQKNSD